MNNDKILKILEETLTLNEKAAAKDRLSKAISSTKRDFVGEFEDERVKKDLENYFNEQRAEHFKRILYREFGRDIRMFLYAYYSYLRNLSAQEAISKAKEKEKGGVGITRGVYPKIENPKKRGRPKKEESK